MTRRYWLEITEYVFLAGSVIGTIAAAATQQVVYAAVPLTITVGLNMDNRNRINRLGQQQQLTGLTHLHQIIDPLEERLGVMEALTEEVKTWVQEHNTEGKEAIAVVQRSINPLRSTLEQLKTQTQQLDTRTQQQLREFKENQLETKEAAVEQIEQFFSRIRDHLAQLEALAHQVNPATTAQLAAMEGAIADLHNRFTPIQTQLDHLSAAERPVGEAIDSAQVQEIAAAYQAQVQEHIEALLTPLRSDIDDLKARVEEHHPVAAELQDLRATVTQLQANVSLPLDVPSMAVITPEVNPLAPTATLVALQRSNGKSHWHCLYALNAHRGGVNAIAISRHGQTFASGSDDHTIKLWNLSSGQELRTINPPNSSSGAAQIKTVALSPDGQILASGGDDKTIKLWHLSPGRANHVLSGHGGTVKSIAFSPDGQTLISGSDDKTVRIWHVPSGELLRTLTGHSEWFTGVKSVAISPKGDVLASSSDDKTIKLWSLATGENLRTLLGHHGTINGLTFSPDGQTLISSSDDNTLKIWQVSDGRELTTLSGHHGAVHAVAVSPNGRFLASGSWDQTINLWDFGTGTKLETLTGHSAAVVSLAFGQERQGNGSSPLWLVSGSSDNTIRIWQQV